MFNWWGTVFRQVTAASEKCVAVRGNALSACGVVLIVGAVFGFKAKWLFPGGWALIPVLGAVCLIAAGPDAWINRKLLSNKVLVWIGLVSYPLYLWHWPLLSFARIIAGDRPTIKWRLLCVVAAFVLSALTYYAVERPLRFGGYANRKTIGLFFMMLLLGTAGLVIDWRQGFPARMKAEMLERVMLEPKGAAPVTVVTGMQKMPYDAYFYWQREVNADHPTTLFIGDSNMEQYMPRILHLADTNPESANIMLMWHGGCVPLSGMEYKKEGAIASNYAGKALALAKQRSDITRVVIAADWYIYIHGRGYGKIRFRAKDGGLTVLANWLADDIRKFTELGKTVF
ncbi:MAG: acyltransferase, partial [Burkholderiaceae bacterium]|nr:acyltransferase [Burkholderiaceae bacterium]